MKNRLIKKKRLTIPFFKVIKLVLFIFFFFVIWSYIGALFGIRHMGVYAIIFYILYLVINPQRLDSIKKARPFFKVIKLVLFIFFFFVIWTYIGAFFDIRHMGEYAIIFYILYLIINPQRLDSIKKVWYRWEELNFLKKFIIALILSLIISFIPVFFFYGFLLYMLPFFLMGIITILINLLLFSSFSVFLHFFRRIRLYQKINKKILIIGVLSGLILAFLIELYYFSDNPDFPFGRILSILSNPISWSSNIVHLQEWEILLYPFVFSFYPLSGLVVSLIAGICFVYIKFFLKLIKSKKIIFILLLLIFFIFSTTSAFAYFMGPGSEVHQHITKEAGKIWIHTPYYIKAALTNRTINTGYINKSTNTYTLGDLIINGSAEEDVPILRAFNHFWQPDDSQFGGYRRGLPIIVTRYGSPGISAFMQARYLWHENIINSYLKGNENQSLYYLGRVAHLLEDLAQPSHVHFDCHIGSKLAWLGLCESGPGDNWADDSVLEEYTANSTIFMNYNGSTYVGQQYNYERLPNIGNKLLIWENSSLTNTTVISQIQNFINTTRI